MDINFGCCELESVKPVGYFYQMVHAKEYLFETMHRLYDFSLCKKNAARIMSDEKCMKHMI